MEAWSNFFLGQLGASAALAGLLFVSVSVNQARILELGRMADRALEALLILFLVLATSSLALVPEQPVRLFGAEILLAGIAALAVMRRLEKAYLATIDPEHRPTSMRMVRLNLAAVGAVALGGLILLLFGGTVGFVPIVLGVLGSFAAAGANAWVLLIEINR